MALQLFRYTSKALLPASTTSAALPRPVAVQNRPKIWKGSAAAAAAAAARTAACTARRLGPATPACFLRSLLCRYMPITA